MPLHADLKQIGADPRMAKVAQVLTAGLARRARTLKAMSFLDKAKDFLNEHDEQVDKVLEKVGDEVDNRTGNKYSSQIDKGVDEAQKRTGDGDTQP
jgi:hypothetical protein